MKSFRLSLVAAGIVCLPHIAAASAINAVSYASLTGLGLVTFNDIAGGTPPGTNYDGIFTSGGEKFAERFVGQTLTANGDFDTLSGAPTVPLTLQPGTSGHNLNVFDLGGGDNVLTGLGTVGFPSNDAIGEGSFAVLFSSDQSQFGFELLGGESDPTTGATIDFFRRDGSLIDRVVLLNLSAASYGFSRDLGIKDIAGISIFNNDPGGIGFDNLKFDVPTDTTVPEPGTLTLLGIGAVVLLRRVKRSA